MKMGNSPSRKEQKEPRKQGNLRKVAGSSEMPVCTTSSTSSLTTDQTTKMISVIAETTTTTKTTTATVPTTTSITTSATEPAGFASLPNQLSPSNDKKGKNSPPSTMPVNVHPPVPTGSKIDRNDLQTSGAPCGGPFLATFPFGTNDLLHPRGNKEEEIMASAVAEDPQRDVFAPPDHDDTDTQSHHTSPIGSPTAPPIVHHSGVGEIDDDFLYDYVEALQINSSDDIGPGAENYESVPSWDPAPHDSASEYVGPEQPLRPDVEVSGEYMALSKSDMTVDKLDLLHISRLLCLDNSALNIKNWYDFARSFFDEDVCDNLNRCYCGGGDPASLFLENLKTRDEFGVEGLMGRCKKINRHDIFNYLNELIEDKVITTTTSIEDLLSIRNPAVKDRLARYLDFKTPSICCWKHLATTYKYTNAEIDVIGAAIKEHHQYSPTEALIRKIQTEIPELSISLFIEKLEQIGRHDLVKEMETIVAEIEEQGSEM